MNLRACLVVLSLVVCTAVTAQETNPYTGTWKASWEGKRGNLQAKVTITDSGGTWKTATSSHQNPCAGVKAELSVTNASPQELVFDIKFSEALRGCRDVAVTLKPVDDRTLKGFRDSTVELTLVRD